MPEEIQGERPQRALIKRFEELCALGIYVVVGPCLDGREVHIDEEGKAYISSAAWEGLFDKRLVVRLVLNALVRDNEAMCGGDGEVLCEIINALPVEMQELPSRLPASHSEFIGILFDQMGYLLGRIATQSGIPCVGPLAEIESMRNGNFSSEGLRVYLSRLDEFYLEVRAAMRKDFRACRLDNVLSKSRDSMLFSRRMHQVLPFVVKWGMVLDYHKPARIRNPGGEFAVEKIYLSGCIELLQLYLDPEREDTLRRVFVESNMAAYAFNQRQRGRKRVPGKEEQGVRLWYEQNVPSNNTELFFQINIRDLAEEDPAEKLEEIRSRLHSWMNQFFHHIGPSERDRDRYLEERLMPVFEGILAEIRSGLGNLVSRIPQHPHVSQRGEMSVPAEQDVIVPSRRKPGTGLFERSENFDATSSIKMGDPLPEGIGTFDYDAYLRHEASLLSSGVQEMASRFGARFVPTRDYLVDQVCRDVELARIPRVTVSLYKHPPHKEYPAFCDMAAKDVVDKPVFILFYPVVYQDLETGAIPYSTVLLASSLIAQTVMSCLFLFSSDLAVSHRVMGKRECLSSASTFSFWIN